MVFYFTVFLKNAVVAMKCIQCVFVSKFQKSKKRFFSKTLPKKTADVNKISSDSACFLDGHVVKRLTYVRPTFMTNTKSYGRGPARSLTKLI